MRAISNGSPGISVILVAYNAEKTIDSSIRSVLQQTYQNFELIVVDDHSQDHTLHAAEEAIQHDTRARILQNEQQFGFFAACSKAVQQAKAEWVAFLSSEDLWDAEKLEKQCARMEKNPFCSLFFTGSLFVDENGKPFPYRLKASEKVTYKDLLRQDQISFSSILARKSLFQKEPMQGEKTIADEFAVLLKLLRTVPCAEGWDEPLLICRRSVTGECGTDVVTQWKIYRHAGVSNWKAGYYALRYANKPPHKYVALPRHSLREHQLVMLDMLQDLDQICKKYEIPYLLFAGTLLGAVRHQGFIPWDDDIDIVMLRDDYDRFLQIPATEFEQKDCFLQKEFSAHWPMFFSKLRRNHTACIERDRPKDPERHLGVYIDIFPCDNLYENRFLRKMQFAASKVVIAKSLDRRGYLTDHKGKKAVQFVCRLLPMKPFLQFTQNRAGKTKSMVHTFFGAASQYRKNIYPREWFTKVCTMQFEGYTFPVSASYQELLTQLYGDYQMLPTPEQRACKVHAELVDLHRSYQDYITIQKCMEFQGFTRSIR